MKIFTHTQYNQNNTPRCHAELGWQRERQSYSDGSAPALTRRSRSAASDRSAKTCPAFGFSGKLMQAIPSGKTLKQVQGDSYLVGNTAQPPHCHAELVSASVRIAKPRQSFGLSGKSRQSLQAGKTLPSRDILHEIKNLSQNLTFSQLLFGRVAKAVKQVQGDSSLCAYMQGGSLCFHPNINYRISFGALKKNQFDGIDLAVVEKFKAPIEKFNSNDDLQNWAKWQAETIAHKDFGGRQEETQIQRKAMIKEWTDYIFKENDAYNNATALLILNAVTKDLKADNDKLPPVLNKGVLADCISEIDKNTKADKKYQFDLNKMYETKLRALYIEDTKTEAGNTGWVVIPSKDRDPKNFEQNVEKLKTLSHKNWCTKSFNAEPYLSEGDFHVYLENGQPKLGVRFVKNAIEEIQGEKNDGKVPVSFFDEVKKHIDENGFNLRSKAKKEIESAQKVKAEIDKVKADLKDAIESNDAKAIFNYFNISVEEDEEGFLTISEYRQPALFSYSDIGVDEDRLFVKVRKILGNAEFEDGKLTDLGNLESIGGWANFSSSQVVDLGKLRTIGRIAAFSNSKITSLGKLESIGHSAHFEYSQITSLGNLKSIGGEANFQKSKIKNLGNLESIGGSAYFWESEITDLGKLKSIGQNAHFNNSQITNLGNLKTIGGDAHFENSQITSLENLKSIGGSADFEKSMVTNLGNLKSIGGDAHFEKSQITDLGNLESIGRYAGFSHSKVANLGNLVSIEGDVDFDYSKIADLGKLESIGGDAYFQNSQIINLGNLKAIGKSAYFGYSQVTDLGNLESIGANAYFTNSQITNLANLKSIGGSVLWGKQIEDFGKLETVDGQPFVPFK